MYVQVINDYGTSAGSSAQAQPGVADEESPPDQYEDEELAEAIARRATLGELLEIIRSENED